MIKIIGTLLTSFILCSCGTGLNVKKSNFKPLEKNLSVTFANTSYSSNQKNKTPTLLELFYVFDASSGFISLSISDSGWMQLSFNDSATNHKKEFKGNLSSKGYYEIYLQNKKKGFPPLISFLYSDIDIYRLRIGLTNEGNLIIDYKVENSKSFFIYGAGFRERKQFYFMRSN